MTITSIPKARLVSLIADELGATDRAAEYFSVESAALKKRLASLPKTSLIAFLLSLGLEAKAALHSLESAFPFRRPPTFYLTIVEESPGAERLIADSATLAGAQRTAGISFEEGTPVRFIYMPEEARIIQTRLGQVIQLQVHYERKVEIVQPDPKAADYGMPIDVYSLETAFTWLPTEGRMHALIGCCDFPALRPMRSYFLSKLGLDLNPPFLSADIFEKITHGADPRSATFTIRDFRDDLGNVQHVTLTDIKLKEKRLYTATAGDPDRQQSSGFFANHPGLLLGGLGVARRDGKIWTPRRLDAETIADLAVTIIDQAEIELANSRSYSDLVNYYFHARVKVGDNLLDGRAKDAWMMFVPHALEAFNSPHHESQLSAGLLARLIVYANRLRLLSAVELDCPACRLTLLATCPQCRKPLAAAHNGGFAAKCPDHGPVAVENLACECGEPAQIVDLMSQVRLIPEPELVASIAAAGKKFNLLFEGFLAIRGRLVQHLPPRHLSGGRFLRLSDFDLWKSLSRIKPSAAGPLPMEEVDKVLNLTREKCKRDGQTPSKERCAVCTGTSLDPTWIRNGKTCLLRLFGVPIHRPFDGVHSGGEIADLLYTDVHSDTGQSRRIGIHVKSRRRVAPPEGLGRTTRQVRELYTQLVYSAARALAGDYPLDVLGVGIPNQLHPEVIHSMASVTNALGFPLLVVDETDWQRIINRAFEAAEFDSKPVNPPV